MKRSYALLALLILGGLLMASCSLEPKEITKTQLVNASNYQEQGFELATFAGGCFWCIEAGFQEFKGVAEAVSGYTGGEMQNPTYQNHGDHVEAVQVYYDPNNVTYRELVDEFWFLMDPTDEGGQFYDRGSSYISAVFVHNESQREDAEESKQALIDSDIYDDPIVTPILDAQPFYRAEEYHQDYYKKASTQYKLYEQGSGRAAHKEEAKAKAEETQMKSDKTNTYVKPSDAQIKEMLTDLEYKVTQKGGTERPFDNAYWNNTADGIYVDVVTGEPLFSSIDKYKSGTGWPSFTKPLVAQNVVNKTDFKLLIPRTEVRSVNGDSHLGHVFKDGPKEDGGLRYCLNSASLRFIPVDKLEAEGYGEFASLFEE